MKAGRLVSGEFMVEKSIKDGAVFLVIVAEDASKNTKKKFNNMCAYRQIDLIEYSTKEMLANSIGKEVRATIGICDEGFANSIMSIIENK
jgi:ribosomal protein L7Ae-like RNA K-turn-binding protein